ncbi:MAG: nitroreductase family protein [Alphaproteobacteria bacterium HGW-Alphaproteobacteria-5]|jgi:nitroreductase|nr:MAG: nitroreductase family protein [Alphaproteobacteria bacterium HGW-Alphaproteobacteria-5]
MNVSEAVAARSSVRAYLDKPVSRELIEDILLGAARAPSGGNLQPWHVHALTGERLAALLGEVAGSGAAGAPGYRVYPENLPEPYRTRRYEVGEQLYATISIPREDREGRLRQLSRNAAFFGAPVGLFVLVDRLMGPPQWADLGMFIQTLMLLAVERGLDCCAQEYWSLHSATVETFLAVPEGRMLFCGIALGYRDPAAPINGFRTRRADASEWSTLHGFAS